MEKRKCEQCGTWYTPYSHKQRFCSKDCLDKNVAQRQKTCPVCLKKFEGQTKTCSDQCRRIHERYQQRFRERLEKYGKLLIQYGRENMFSKNEAVWNLFIEDHKEIFKND